MKKVSIVHNPRCSKSRETLKIIESRNFEVEIIDYLHGGLNEELLTKIITQLGVPAQEVLRTKEDEFKTLDIDLHNQKEVIRALLEHPKLLERPIVIRGERALIARPPEKVIPLLVND